MKKIKSKKLVFFLFLALHLFLFQDINASASSWTSDSDQSIYGDSETYSESPASESSEEPGYVEKFFIDLITSVADGLYNLLNTLGINIDLIVFGRVNGNAPNGIALFTFELKTGNPFGIVGALLYSILRSIAYVVIFVIVFGKVSLSAFTGATPKAREKFKENLTRFALALLLLTAMPYFLDVLLYIRDVILSVVATESTSSLFGFENSSLITTFRTNASVGLINSFMYSAIVIFTVYLALQYIGYAMNFLICFMAFPFVIIGYNIDKNLLSSWFKQVITVVCTPILDATLFLVPSYIGVMNIGIDTSVICLFTCLMIVPARNILKQLIGLSGGGGLDMVGMSMLLGAGKLIGATGSAVKRTIGGVSAARSDMNMSKYYGQMGGEGKSFNGAQTETSGEGESLNGAMTETGSGINSSRSLSTDNSVQAMNNSPSGNAGNHGFSNSSDLADKFANVNNFESAPFSSNISPQRMSELYRKRSSARMLGAIGTGIGGLAGGVAAAGATMFYGPGAMMAAAGHGVSAGSDIGSGTMTNAYNLLHSNSNLSNNSGNTFQSQSQSVSRETAERVEGEPVSNHTPSIIPDSAGIQSNTNIAKEAYSYCIMNKQAAHDSAEVVKSNYIDNPEKYMAPVWNNIKANPSFSTDNARKEAFRQQIANNYTSDFSKNYLHNSNTKLSGNSNVDNASLNAYKEVLKKTILDKNNTSSWLSDNALNSYSWMA